MKIRAACGAGGIRVACVFEAYYYRFIGFGMFHAAFECEIHGQCEAAFHGVAVFVESGCPAWHCAHYAQGFGIEFRRHAILHLGVGRGAVWHDFERYDHAALCACLSCGFRIAEFLVEEIGEGVHAAGKLRECGGGLCAFCFFRIFAEACSVGFGVGCGFLLRRHFHGGRAHAVEGRGHCGIVDCCRCHEQGGEESEDA